MDVIKQFLVFSACASAESCTLRIYSDLFFLALGINLKRGKMAVDFSSKCHLFFLVSNSVRIGQNVQNDILVERSVESILADMAAFQLNSLN